MNKCSLCETEISYDTYCYLFAEDEYAYEKSVSFCEKCFNKYFKTIKFHDFDWNLDDYICDECSTKDTKSSVHAFYKPVDYWWLCCEKCFNKKYKKIIDIAEMFSIGDPDESI